MPKTININETVEEIVNLKRQIDTATKLLNSKKKYMSDFFKESGERSVSNSDITIYVQEKTSIEYDIPEIYNKLGKESADRFVDKKYSVEDWKNFIKFLKSKGIENTDLKQFITITKEVNKDALSKLYEENEITIQDLEGCYTAEVTKSVALRMKKDEKSETVSK